MQAGHLRAWNSFGMRAIVNSLEVFVADDAFEGGAAAKRNLFDDFELIGESDTREGAALLECCHS